MPLHVSSTCAHRQEAKIVLYSLGYHHTYRWPSRARKFLAQNNITTLPPPTVQPWLGFLRFFLFPKLKTHLKGHNFGTVENVQAAATRALNNISSEDFLHCYEEWQQSWNRCIRSQGAYFEGDKLQLYACSIKKFVKNHSHYFSDRPHIQTCCLHLQFSDDFMVNVKTQIFSSTALSSLVVLWNLVNSKSTRALLTSFKLKMQIHDVKIQSSCQQNNFVMMEN